MQVVAVLNRKGGVGKTTLAVNLAAVLSGRLPTVLVDADAQRSASMWLTSPDPEVLPVVLASDPKALTRELRREGRGVVVADGPPWDFELNQFLYQRADLVVVPVTPSGMDINAATPLLKALVESNRPGLVVLNRVNPRTALGRQAREAVARFGVPVARTEIGHRIAQAEAPLTHKPVTEYAPSSPSTVEFNLLADEITEALGV